MTGLDELEDMPTSSISQVMRRLYRKSDKQQSIFFFSTLALALSISLISVAAGFIYGDYYGRKHAQYDSNELRKHYAGECYAYMDTQLKKSIKTSLDKQSRAKDQVERLDDIKATLVNIQMDLAGTPHPAHKTKAKDTKKKDKFAYTR